MNLDRRTHAALFSVLALSPLVGTTAHAEPPERSWYGGSTLAAAGGSFTLIAIGAGTDSPALLAVGAASWALTPPAIHFAHGNVGRGFASLGLAVGLPLAFGTMSGAVLGPAFERDGCDDFDCSGYVPAFSTGALAGFLAAPLIDALVLAWDEPEVSDSSEPGGFRPTLILSPTEGGGMLGVGFTL